MADLPLATWTSSTEPAQWSRCNKYTQDCWERSNQDRHLHETTASQSDSNSSADTPCNIKYSKESTEYQKDQNINTDTTEL